MKNTIDHYRKNIQEFANKHKLIFEDQGTCGFGRECVGIKYGDRWVDYNPYSYSKGDLEEFYDERFYAIAPKNAYHKHDCLAVLGRSDEAIKQLSQWIDRLKELNVEVRDYETGATGIQAILSGITGKTLYIPR